MSLGKPKIMLCWHCNRRFHGRHHATLETENGNVQVHIACAREMERDGLVHKMPATPGDS
jgi:hypothetical protein